MILSLPQSGMWALYAREVKRFQKLWMDTIFNPIVSVGLYLAVFGVIAGDRTINGVPYLAFIYVGLLSMNLINASISNPAFALIISKNLGTIVDLQLAPISPWRVGLAYALAALTRGVITLAVGLALTVWLIPLNGIAHPFLLLFAIALTGIQFGIIGVAFGMWAKNFEALTFLTTFILQPMIFLAGVFYPIDSLPTPWNIISQFNPLHHNVNLLRFAVTDYADGNPWKSLLVVVVLLLIVTIAMQYIVKKKLRSE
ncbi:MAG: ABC transporter permease [Patescibacteria group bacterium]